MKPVSDDGGFEFPVDHKAGVAIVAIPNEALNKVVDSAGRATFLVEAQDAIEAVIDEKDRPKVIVDFSGVQIVSSGVIGLLIEMSRQAQSKGGTLIVAGLQPQVSQVFSIARLERVLNIQPTVDDALRAID
jgi:anti-anti-sigma factor